MASTSPSISIFVEPPSEDLCPLDFGDGTMVVDPPCDTIGFAAHFLSDPYDVQRGFAERSHRHAYELSGKEGTDNLALPQDRLDFACDHYPAPRDESHPYPFGSLSYNVPRSPTEDYSPYSSTLGDDFAPSTPSAQCGSLSPSNSGSGEFPQSSLSPTLLGDLTLPFTELTLDYTSQSTSAFRVRSHSVTERTVAPSDTWCDPTTRTAVRSAPSTTSPLPEAPIAEHTTPGNVTHYNAYQLGGEIVSPGSESGFFAPQDEVYPSGAGPEQVAYHHPDAGNALLLWPEMLHMESGPSASSSHRRGYSDPSGFLSPTSPIDQYGCRMQYRRTSSASGSVRHAPYPASAPATPEAKFGLPELAEGHGVQRRHTRPSISRPKLSIDVPYPLVGNEGVASNQYVYPTLPEGEQEVLSHVPSIAGRNDWDQVNEFNQPSSSMQFVHGDHSSAYTLDQISPNSAVSSTSSPGWKDVVGSQKIVDASQARRKRESKFVCEVPGCSQTFTAKHNWNYHKLSHTGERPFPCGKCDDRFTTPGVANRHRTKCPGFGGTTKRRRAPSSTASPSKSSPE